MGHGSKGDENMNISIWTNDSGEIEFSGVRSDGQVVSGNLEDNDKVKDFTKILDRTKTEEETKKENDLKSHENYEKTLEMLQGGLSDLFDIVIQLQEGEEVQGLSNPFKKEPAGEVEKDGK